LPAFIYALTVAQTLVETENVPVGYWPVELVAVGEQKPDVAHVCAFTCLIQTSKIISRSFFI